MSATRKNFEIHSDDEKRINQIRDFFKSKDSIVNLDIYSADAGVFILIAEFSTPLKVSTAEEPFTGTEFEKFISYEKKKASLDEQYKSIFTMGGKKPAKKPTAPKASTIDEKLDRIIELIEKLVESK